MANGADGSIIIDSTLDNSGFKRGSKELENAIKGLKSEVLSIGDGMRSAVQTMQTALQDMGSAAQENGSKFQEFLDTQEFDKAMGSMQKTAQGLASDLMKIGNAESQGVKPGTQLQNLEQHIADTQQRLNGLREQMIAFGDLKAGDTTEYSALKDQWSAVVQELQAAQKELNGFRKLGLADEFLESYIRKCEQAEEKANAISRKMTDLEESGEAFKFNSDSEEFQQLEENYNQMTEALQVYKQALAEAKNERVAKTQELQQERAEAAQLEAQTRAAAEAEREAAAQEKAQASSAREAAQSVSGFSQVLSTISSTAAHAAASLGRLVLQGVTTGIKAAGRAMTELGSALLRAGSAATKAMASIGKLGLKAVAMGARAATKHIGDMVAKLRSLSSHGSKATLTSNGLVKALTGFKRMLISRIKRTFISTVFKDLQLGLHSFAKYSSAFNTAMSNMKNSMTALSGNIGVLAGNLITALAPALTTIIDWFSRAIEYVSAFFALISGKSTYTVAKKGTADYAASLDKSKKAANNAQGAVHDLKNEVYGFDELNKASGSSNSGGSSGSGADAAEDEIQFMEKSLASLPNGISDFMQNLKNAFNAKEFRRVGELLSSGLNYIVDAGNKWITGTLRPKAKEWTANITEILNGMIANFNWDKFGELTAQGLNLIIDVLRTFVKAFEFTTLAIKLTDYINSLIANIEWDALGDTVGTTITKIVESMTQLESGIAWDNLGASISKGVNSLTDSLDFTQAKRNARLAGIGIANGINSLATRIHWNSLGKKIADGGNVIIEKVNGFVTNLNIAEISKSLADGFNGLIDGVAWNTLGENVGTATSKIIEGISKLGSEINWTELASNVGSSVNSLIDSLDLTEAKKNAREAAKGIANGINSLTTRLKWDNIGKKIGEGGNIVIGAVNTFVETLNINQIVSGITSAVNSLATEIEWETLGSTIGTATSKIVEGITGLGTGIEWENLGTKIGDGVNSLVANLDLKQAKKNAVDSAKGIANGINSLSTRLRWENIGKKIGEGGNIIIEAVNTFVTNLNINQVKEDLASGFSGLLSTVNWEALGEATGTGLGKITAAVVGFPATLLRRSGGVGRRLGIALNSAVRSVPWSTIGSNFGESLKAIMEDITSFVKGVDWTKVGASIGDLLSNIDVLEIVSKLADAIAASANAGLKLAEGIVDSIVSGLDGETLTTKFNNVAKSIITNLTNLMTNGVRFGTKLVTAGAKIAQTMLSSITNAFRNVKDSGLSDQFSSAATKLLQNLLQNISGLTGNAEVQTFLQNLGQSIIDGMGALGSIVGDFCGKLLGYMFSKEGLTDILNAGVSLGNLVFAGIMQGLTGVGNFLKEMVTSMLVNWGVLDAEEVAAAKEAGEALADNTAEAFKQAANGNPAITEGMEVLVNWANWRGGQNRSEITPAAQNLVSEFNAAINGAIQKSDTGASFRDAVLENMFWSNDDWLTKALENNIDLSVENLDIEKTLSQLQIDPNTVLPNFNDLKFWDSLLEAIKSGNASDIMTVVNDTLTTALATVNEKTEELAKETADSTNKNAELVAETYEQIVKDTQNAVTVLNDTMDESVSAMGEKGIATAVANGTQPVKDAALQVSDEAVQVFLATMSEENGKKIGKQFIVGIQSGLEEAINELLTAMTQFMTVNGAGESEMFSSLGYAIDTGIAKGIRDYQSIVINAAEDAAWNAYVAACDELRIGSPSRVFAEVGKFSMMGWAEGMESQENAMLQTVADLAGITADGFNPELTLGGNDFLYGLDTVADKLHEIVDTFTALADTLNGMGGLPMPAIATGDYVPYRVRYGDDMTAAPAYGATETFTRNFDETMSDQRDVLREILNAIRDLDFSVDGRTLERSLSNLQRDRIRAYGGG